MGLRGRWDRNRTCNLRCWSLLPFVQQRSRKYKTGLKIAHFDGPTCQEVHQSSPEFTSVEVKIGVKTNWIFHFRLDATWRCRCQEVKQNLSMLANSYKDVSALNVRPWPTAVTHGIFYVGPSSPAMRVCGRDVIARWINSASSLCKRSETVRPP